MKKIDTKLGETIDKLLKEKFGEKFDWLEIRVTKNWDGSYELHFTSDYLENLCSKDSL